MLLLRDVEGLPAPDVCELLGVSDGNQRVLLHRAGYTFVSNSIGRCTHETAILATSPRARVPRGRRS